MIGNNIRIARMSIGISLQELADSLTQMGIPTTKATLSNYETGKYIPSDEFLQILSRELKCGMEFFDVQSDFNSDIRFFKKPDMVNRKQQNLEAFITKELVRFKFVDDILGINVDWKPTTKKFYTMNDSEAIENLAYQFRTEHGAGSHAIASICDILERRGWHIFALPDFCAPSISISGYDSITGIPFILYKPDGYQDEMRLSLLRNVGYSMIESETQSDTDNLVDRFARAVLLPENLVRKTFGNKRTVLTEHELSTTKRMYGLGKKYVFQRMYELGIVDDDLYADYSAYITQRYDLVRSSGLLDDSAFFDMPTSYEMRVQRANAEGLSNIISTRTLYYGKEASRS